MFRAYSPAWLFKDLRAIVADLAAHIKDGGFEARHLLLQIPIKTQCLSDSCAENSMGNWPPYQVGWSGSLRSGQAYPCDTLCIEGIEHFFLWHAELALTQPSQAIAALLAYLGCLRFEHDTLRIKPAQYAISSTAVEAQEMASFLDTFGDGSFSI